MSSLTVYKASAGSGKTFTLAVEYLKHLVDDPTSFRHILAVTFTNKATDEMKMRILGQLYGISRHLPDSSDYLQKIADATGMDKADIECAAGQALTLLVHNYDYFHVETIDTFFQSVLRNLARELDLSANLKVELNDTGVESQAVDIMIEELDAKSPLFSWLVKYVMDKIDENKSWNIIRSVKDFGKMIFDDEYRLHSKIITEKLSDPGFIKSFQNKLVSIRLSHRKTLADIQKEFLERCSEYGIELTDFKGGDRTGIQNYFMKLTSDNMKPDMMASTVAKYLDSAENWTTKKNVRANIIKQAANEVLIPLLEKAEQKRKEALYHITTVNATLKNLNSLRLLNDIEQSVRKLNAEANRFLLSDTQHLLRNMVSENDSPFIFEKIGTQLRHIMIDEFQDTSTVQWSNFKILLDECMSQQAACERGVTGNLIVGDVKQSIYRWRSGDWQLLNNMGNGVGRFPVEVKNLQTNYRSARNIVDFNNAFFAVAVDKEYERECKTDEGFAKQIKQAYGDVAQIPHKQEPDGLVEISLLPVNSEYVDSTLRIIADDIIGLIGKGVEQKDIAILVRNNKHIPVIAEYFMEYYPELNIVSDEAFRLDHSDAVGCIVSALRYLYNEDDLLTKANLAKYYAAVSSNGQDDSMTSALINDSTQTILPKDFICQIEDLKTMPLFDLCEKLLVVFSLDKLKSEGAYICAFFDYLSKYIKDMSADVSGFIKEWDDNLHAKTIQTDSVDGIRLISIHKSKGLEFDNVIIPFCDWKLEISGGHLWCSPDSEPYSELPLLPVDYNSALAHSAFLSDYKLEHMQNNIDNLNLLYVAFTRPKRNMFVIGNNANAKGGITRSKILVDCIHDVAGSLDGAEIETDADTEAEIFRYGTLSIGRKKDKDDTANVFLQPDKTVNVEIDCNENPVEFRQSNNSKKFIADATESVNEENAADNESRKKRGGYIKMGNILHIIFSKIKTTSDIPNVLSEYEANGILYDGELDRDSLERTLKKCMEESETVRDWFSPRWILFNECTILCEDIDPQTGEKTFVQRRPDRVMKCGDEVVVVDFKFGKMDERYIGQVKSYIRYLKEMGYQNVKGYLWFVMKNEVKEVTE